ncbi:hypothetical protein HOU00_gp284 [Caulobacter phage CcrPW]|uniref:Uncharacterized protein n=1 Tax=Caulobacter phage CcrPW TaxID=2283271 RepID=A0A385EAD5_9CAUD|nr:hypothetical protein HOU00_gp284 [Caulobacter phage CcrPW]AXQ68841.1 hypothetical protein CcrPW_gp302 [Caulobacter phage CcrPW]
MTRVVSPQIIHVLELAEKGRDIWWVPLVDGKGSQSRTVGRQNTIYTAQRHGWLDKDDKLTPAGKIVLAEQQARATQQDRFFERQARLKGTHWERGYRVHGFWRGGERLGTVSLGPPALWDGVYSWAVDNHGPSGTATKLADAKRLVEDAIAFPDGHASKS